MSEQIFSFDYTFLWPLHSLRLTFNFGSFNLCIIFAPLAFIGLSDQDFATFRDYYQFIESSSCFACLFFKFGLLIFINLLNAPVEVILCKVYTWIMFSWLWPFLYCTFLGHYHRIAAVWCCVTFVFLKLSFWKC